MSIDDMPVAAFFLDELGTIININDKVSILLGYQSESLIGSNIIKLLPDNAKLQYQQMSENLTAVTKQSIPMQALSFCHKDKTIQPFSVTLSSVAHGSLMCLYQDNDFETEHNQDGRLLESAHAVLQCINEPYWEWHVGQDNMHFSAQLMSLLGYEKKALTTSTNLWKKHISREQLKIIIPKIEQHLNGESPNIDTNLTLSTRQNEQLWVHLLGKVLEFKEGKPYRMYGSVSNITEAKSLLEQLKKQNEYLNLAEKVSNSGHWRYDVLDNSFFCSPEIYHIFGVKAEQFEFSLDAVISFYDLNERDLLRSNIIDALKNGHSFYCKKNITQPIGRKLKVETIANVELDDEGKVCSFFGVCRDVSATENAFEKLKLLAMVNHTIKVPIFFIDDKDNIVYQDISSQENGKNVVLFNYVNFSISEYLALKNKAKIEGQIKQNNISFDKFTTIFDLSVTYQAEAGIYIWIVENVTDKFRKEQQQIISNRLALLGNTFGSVSHDINNVLGVALGSIEMLELKFKQGSKDVSSYIDRVKNAIDKGKSVTERLLAFTRKPTIKVVQFNPIKDIEDNKYLLKQVVVTSIGLTIDIDDAECLIKFPQGEFINILLNLVLNAQDAIQEKGLSGQIVISANTSAANTLEIHVKDSGVGIKPENLTKVFDPFYSSKSVNKGNGIGLANVYSTMYKHNGQVLVEGESELGGAHFTLVFPCEPIITRSKPQVQKKDNLHIANKRVLILDDEISIAEFVAMYLESEGASCVHVSSKKSLLATLNEGLCFDMFITDMILPDFTGREAVDFVKEKYPDIDVYSISGYIAQEDRQWNYPVLRKPFNSKELADFLLH